MAHFKAIVKKGTHKTQPYTVTVDKRVDTKVKQRYKTQYSAERGALRQFRPQGEGLPKYKYSAVLIELPGGRRRMGFIYPCGTMHFNPIVTPKAKRK